MPSAHHDRWRLIDAVTLGTMTLRLRLVLALLVLVTAGLVAFGVVTTSWYSRAEYQRLDDQLQSSVSLVTGELLRAGGGDDDGSRGPGRSGGRGPFVVAPGTYGELRDADGQLLATLQTQGQTTKPELADTIVAAEAARLSTVDSIDGPGDWRVYVGAGPGPTTLVVVVPLTEVSESIRRLVLIEMLAAFGLLVVLGGGSWLILRRGLQPLEEMSRQATGITAGDLSQRVGPADERTEIGRLGQAINAMLSEIEDAFRERDATEHRLRQFLADASHELRTPLTSIQGFAELFRLGADQDRVQLEVVFRRIEQESERMRDLVEDLLLLARLDETRPVERHPTDLAVLCADACSDAVALAPDRPVTLDAPEPVVVMGVADHLRQAIANLVSNAVHHTPDGTPIEVSALVEDGAAIVRVRDHGPGVPADVGAKVFDRFWQADPARVGPSSGLGLSIVAAIAAQHGGVARVGDAADGGAVFTLSLPHHHPSEA